MKEYYDLVKQIFDFATVTKDGSATQEEWPVLAIGANQEVMAKVISNDYSDFCTEKELEDAAVIWKAPANDTKLW